jgi:ferredoxin
MIIFFSGTGNTKKAALALAEKLGDSAIQLSAETLTDPASATLRVTDGRIIWMFPTYSWGVPPVVKRFIMEATISGAADAEHWMVTTCGDDVGQTDRMWRRLMTLRGYRTVGAFSVIMPNTYVCMKGFDVDSPELTQSKLNAMDQRIDLIAKRIETGDTSDDLTRGSFAWFKTAVIYPWFVKFDMSPKGFSATDDCTGCGKCRRHCPMGNIKSDKDGRPVWGENCAFCLGCYHVCPCHSVAYGKTTRTKGQKTVY